MPVNVTEVIQEFIRNLLTDRTFAAQFAEDPNGMVAAQGITDHDLSSVDMPGAVRAASADPSVSPETRSTMQGYSGGPSSGPTQGVEQVIQHLNYVTYQTYEGDDYITNMIDNSVNVTGTVLGDVDINQATGDGSQIIDGDNLGQANTGDGAVVAGGDVEDTVDGSADGSVIKFGEGDASNVSGNTLEEGSAISSGGGDATGTNVDVEDNDTTVVTDITDSHDTVTAVQDNDTTINEDNDIAIVEDNDVALGGDDVTAAQ
jgi:hypothetical protein